MKPQRSINVESRNANELKRVLTTRDLVIFGIVFMTPISAQNLFGILASSSQSHAVLSYLFGLVAMLFTAYSYGKMAVAFPVAGSTYSYTGKSIHPYLGFIAGWSILLDYILLPVFIYKISSVFAQQLIPSVPFWAILLLFVIPVTIFNYYGGKLSANVNNVMTVIMVLSIVVFSAFAIYYLISKGGIASIFDMKGIYQPEHFSWNAIISGSSIAVLSYLGFDAVTTMAEDSKSTAKMVGRAAIIACLLTTVLYVSQVYFATLIAPDYSTYKSADTAFFDISKVIGGSFLANFVTIIITISGVSTALASQAAASRILYSMGRDGVLPKFYSVLHHKWKTPVNSIVFMSVIGYFLALFIDLNTLSLIVVFGALIGFICVNLSVFVEYYVRRKERGMMGFIFNVISPLLGALVCAYILYGMDRIGHIVGVCWLLAGILFLGFISKGFKQQANLFSNDNVDIS